MALRRIAERAPVYGTREKTGRQSVAFFDLSWEHSLGTQIFDCSEPVCGSVNNRKTTMGDDLRVTNKF